MRIVRVILDLLTPDERRRGAVLLCMVLLMAFFDAVGVASIMPFMAVLANPGVVFSNPYLSAAYGFFGFSEPQNFLFFLGVGVLVVLVTSISFKAFTTYLLLRFTHMRNYSLGRRLVSGYLYQPYEWFLNRHSADLGKTVLSEVGQVISGIFVPLMTLIAQGAVAIALLCLLVVANPTLAIYVGIGLGVAYGGIYALLRKRLARQGSERVTANKVRFETLTEAFGGIKEVKVGGLEEVFIRRFDEPSLRYASTQVTSQVAAQLPRYALEIISFGGMLLVVLYLMRHSNGFEGALPVIALYAFAGYKLVPAVQNVYHDLIKIRFSAPALNALHQDLMAVEGWKKIVYPNELIKLEHGISLVDVVYAYPNSHAQALKGLNIHIPARSTIGIVGTTGSGKTTTVDIILGLLKPASGQLLIDGKPLIGISAGSTPVDSRDKASAEAISLGGWKRAIGYVPQSIYLADDTVAANIAFGVPPKDIDMAAVEKAARIANLHGFVCESMPDMYMTRVGERGVRLSGGQRQRIGIARALYHDPEVLVLDEATSALDNLTELAVMEAVHNIGHRKTIILIAHRLSTVRECDRIFLLEGGVLVAQGTYEELLAGNARFRAMAGADQ